MAEEFFDQPTGEDEEVLVNGNPVNTNVEFQSLPTRLQPFYNSPVMKRKGYSFRKKPKIIRSCRFSEDKEPDLHYRELMMLYTSWNDEDDLKKNMAGQNVATFKEAYLSWKEFIVVSTTPVRQNKSV